MTVSSAYPEITFRTSGDEDKHNWTLPQVTTFATTQKRYGKLLVQMFPLKQMLPILPGPQQNLSIWQQLSNTERLEVRWSDTPHDTAMLNIPTGNKMYLCKVVQTNLTKTKFQNPNKDDPIKAIQLPMLSAYGFLGNDKLQLVAPPSELITVSFEWNVNDNIPPVAQTDLHTYVLGSLMTRRKVTEELLVTQTFQNLGVNETYINTIWCLSTDIQAYTLDQFNVRVTNANVGDLTGTMTFDSSNMSLGVDRWFYPMAMIHMDATWDYRNDLRVVLSQYDAQLQGQKRKLDDFFSENTIIQQKLQKIDTTITEMQSKPSSSSTVLQLPQNFLPELKKSITDGMTDATMTVTVGSESIWSKLLGVTVGAIATVGGDLGAAAISAAVTTQGNLVNAAVTGLIEGTMNNLVQGMVKTSIDTLSERLNTETAAATTKLFDSIFGKLSADDKNQDRLINEMQLTIVTIRNELQKLQEKLQECVTVDVTKLLQQQSTVNTNAANIAALQVIVDALGKNQIKHSTTLTDLETLGAHNCGIKRNTILLQ
ncbi:hypothetical protein DPMN_104761 [Dreissena polymorpha]|uniref:Uncharacterized protein n=1 Tax=Dreissena polymorpha TaxID=45954 RepID=A0A9D4HCL3_DREPO|nr:hypothetical protein DPMN_104761 [Dreissena polymorpha]